MNIPEYKIQKLLFLKGVFIKDCIPSDDIFEQHIIDRLNINDIFRIFLLVKIKNCKCGLAPLKQ